MALEWVHNKEIPRFQAVILILGLKAQTALQQKAELKILVDMGRAVKHVDEKQFKVHLAVRYDFKFQYTHYQFLVSGLLSIVLFLYCLTLPQCKIEAKESKSLAETLGLNAFKLFKNRQMATFFIFSAMLGMPTKKLDAVVYYEKYIVIKPGAFEGRTDNARSRYKFNVYLYPLTWKIHLFIRLGNILWIFRFYSHFAVSL